MKDSQTGHYKNHRPTILSAIIKSNPYLVMHHTCEKVADSQCNMFFINVINGKMLNNVYYPTHMFYCIYSKGTII